MRREADMMRTTLCTLVAVALLCGCAEKSGPAGAAAGGFPEKQFAAVADKAKQGENICDHALLKKAHAVDEATSQMIHKTWKKITHVEDVTAEERAAMEEAVKAAGFADVKEFLKVDKALAGVTGALMALRKYDADKANDFQKAMIAELVKDATEADLRFVAGLKK
jgi:hypothetical protein